MQRFFDLSATISGTGHLVRQPEIVYLDHEEMARQAAVMYGLRPDDFRESRYCATERLSLGPHDATLVRSPRLPVDQEATFPRMRPVHGPSAEQTPCP